MSIHCITNSYYNVYTLPGYVDRELFEVWFEKVFMVHCGSERPVALLLDNHDSHYSLKVIEMARENQVWQCAL